MLFVSLNVKGVDKGSVELAVDRSLTISEVHLLRTLKIDLLSDCNGWLLVVFFV